MISEHRRNTGPMHSSPRCGAKTRSGKPASRQPFRVRSVAVCMVVRAARAPRAEIKMRLNTDFILVNPLLNAGEYGHCCGNHASCFKPSNEWL